MKIKLQLHKTFYNKVFSDSLQYESVDNSVKSLANKVYYMHRGIKVNKQAFETWTPLIVLPGTVLRHTFVKQVLMETIFNEDYQ